MASRKVKGICHICGINIELTYEHVPPRKAFNSKPVFYQDLQDLLEDQNFLDSSQGKPNQKGVGGYTLCERCNTTTGSWYGTAYVDWTYKAMNVLKYTRGKPSIYYPFYIFPLRVIKQIICMFFSTNGSEFQKNHPDLVKFVLDRKARHLAQDIQICAFYNTSPRSRQSGIAGIFSSRGQHHFSEIAFLPFGYVMTFDSTPPDERMCDISCFADYGFNDWKNLSLNLPILPIYSYLPGDYRTKEELDKILPSMSDE